MALGEQQLQQLAEIVGDAHVLTDADQLASYQVDWTGRYQGQAPAVVRPGSTDQVAGVVQWCRQHLHALVPQGGNTGLAGGSVPLHGELVMSLQRFNRIDPVDMDNRSITVGAGVTLAAAQSAARAVGLRYTLDLGARDSATIGGTVATNAGGINFIRFGGARAQLLGIEAVLGTGQVISDLRGLAKDNTGYWLPGLLCGSEGTLGVITAATLRLRPLPQASSTALVGFDSIDNALAAAAQWTAAADCIESLELMLDSGVELVCRTMQLPAPISVGAACYLLVEMAGSDEVVQQLGAVVHASVGVVDAAVAGSAAQRRALWRYRDEHTMAIARCGVPHKMDVTVPLARMAAFLADVPARVSALDPAAQTWMFGHVGDGNIHVNVTGFGDNGQRLELVILQYVSEIGGSISAEHGIGTAKTGQLALRRSPEEIAVMRSIKAAFDPDGVLNPWVMLAPV